MGAGQLAQDSLEAAVAAAGIDAPPTYLVETGSTNADAASLAQSGAPEWTVVAAGNQTAGRGRLGRSWTSAPGRALLFSVILRPPLPPERASIVSLLAAERMVAAIGDPRVRSKWPNDLVVGDRKLAGILPEARLEGDRLAHVVLGIGVNLSMREEDFPPEVRDAATSLAIEGIEADATALLQRFLRGLREELERDDRRLAIRVVGTYMATCATLGRRVRARTTDGGVVEGLAVGLDRHGGLVLQEAGVPRVVAFGEVEHLA